MKVLLHICCGVCAAGVVERLTQEGHEVRGYFYNPNIHPQEEYEKRLETARKVSESMNFPLEAGPYNPDDWFQATESLKDEPEGGKRCDVCFRFRLENAFRYFEDSDADVFTTTLTVSPRKKADTVNSIGREIGGERFLERDFKKKAGFHRSNELAREFELYRQHYCGCVYSIRED